MYYCCSLERRWFVSQNQIIFAFLLLKVEDWKQYNDIRWKRGGAGRGESRWFIAGSCLADCIQHARLSKGFVVRPVLLVFVESYDSRKITVEGEQVVMATRMINYKTIQLDQEGIRESKVMRGDITTMICLLVNTLSLIMDGCISLSRCSMCQDVLVWRRMTTPGINNIKLFSVTLIRCLIEMRPVRISSQWYE